MPCTMKSHLSEDFGTGFSSGLVVFGLLVVVLVTVFFHCTEAARYKQFYMKPVASMMAGWHCSRALLSTS